MRIAMRQLLFPLYLLPLGSALLLGGCDSGPSEPQVTAPPIAESTGITKKDDPSVRVLASLPEFSLTNQLGETVDTDGLFGHVWVANFIFTRCQDSCPLQTQEMKSLQQYMDASKYSKDLRIVSFSVDPSFDTPEVLTKYMSEHSVNAQNWDFLTGTPEAIWALSKKGFKLPVADNPEDAKSPILHSAQFVLVDWEGRIRGYYDSASKDGISNLKSDMDVVLAERVFGLPDMVSPSWVGPRHAKQISASETYAVFHDFKFSDQLKQSGITFEHKLVDDAAREYKAVHYDHGNAVAVADVDGDGLYDIYFTTQVGSNELWRNTGDGKFVDITDSAGLRVEHGIGVAASFADIDNDGDPDLFITHVRTGNMLFENDGKGHFTNITEQAGVGHKAHSSGAVFFDYDRDGLLDLFVTNVGVYTTEETTNVTLYTKEKGHIVSDYEYYIGFKDAFAGHLKPERTEASILYRNMGGNRFEDVSEKTGLVDTSWTGDATVIDANNDGWPDLYVLNMEGHDQYYENMEGKTFANKSQQMFPVTPWGAMGVKSFDFDNDGDQDLFVSDMHSDMSEVVPPRQETEKRKANMTYPESFLESGGNSIYGNGFYRNDGNGVFTEISDSIGAENFWPWGLGTGDLNADGFEDVFLPSSMNFPFRYGINSLLLNDHGKQFLDSEYVVGVEPRLNGRYVAPVFELQCSGRDSDRKICGKGAKGRKVMWGPLGSRSSVIFDLDQDGDLDIVTLEMDMTPMVLISNLSEQKEDLNFIKIKLVGDKSNRSGIGATIQVVADGHTYTKVNDGKSGYLSQSDLPLYFGLDASKAIEKITVLWPSGAEQLVAGPVSINTLLEIKER